MSAEERWESPNAFEQVSIQAKREDFRVRAEMKVAFDRPIVVAVTMGFRERDMIVMAVRVRKLEHGAAQSLKKQTEEPTR